MGTGFEAARLGAEFPGSSFSTTEGKRWPGTIRPHLAYGAIVGGFTSLAA